MDIDLLNKRREKKLLVQFVFGIHFKIFFLLVLVFSLKVKKWTKVVHWNCMIWKLSFALCTRPLLWFISEKGKLESTLKSFQQNFLFKNEYKWWWRVKRRNDVDLKLLKPPPFSSLAFISTWRLKRHYRWNDESRCNFCTLEIPMPPPSFHLKVWRVETLQRQLPWCLRFSTNNLNNHPPGSQPPQVLHLLFRSHFPSFPSLHLGD